MNIVKLHVEKSLTVQVDDKKWSKTAYRLEADVPDTSPDELEKLRLDLSFKIDDWLGQEKHDPQPKPRYPPDVVQSDIPEIDLVELDACPWQTYQKKPAGPGKAAWIKNPAQFDRFEAPPVLWELVKALDIVRDASADMTRPKPEPLVLGDMQYSYGGDKLQFINRNPTKTESARR